MLAPLNPATMHWHAHPGLQVPKAGWPFPQAGAAVLGKTGAGVLHAPQLAASVLRFTSHPLSGFLSQSAYLQEHRVHKVDYVASQTLQIQDGTNSCVGHTRACKGCVLAGSNSWQCLIRATTYIPWCTPNNAERSLVITLGDGVGRGLCFAPRSQISKCPKVKVDAVVEPVCNTPQN
jgi:hypothetical protein